MEEKMEKAYKVLICIGFSVVYVGGLAYVLLQALGLVIGNPKLVIQAEMLTAIIFPVASASGLLCFLFGYIFKKK